MDFVPAARPPHKGEVPLLPFEFRCQLIQMAIEGLPGLGLNTMEGQRLGPSYTVDTLRAYAAETQAELFFIMGSKDLSTFPSWRSWKEITTLAHLVVANREGGLPVEFVSFVHRYFPEAKSVDPPREWKINDQRLIFMDIPRLDVSSSLIRQKWSTSESLTYLVPQVVIQELKRISATIHKSWSTP